MNHQKPELYEIVSCNMLVIANAAAHCREHPSAPVVGFTIVATKPLGKADDQGRVVTLASQESMGVAFH